MARLTDNWIAYILGELYNFNPPRSIAPSRYRQTTPGKFEPDTKLFEERCFVIAHWFDKTNALIKFDPFALELPSE